MKLIRTFPVILALTIQSACGALADPSATSEGALGKDGRPFSTVAAPDTVLLPDGGVQATGGPLTLLVIFDTSGSMSVRWDARTRWQASYDSVLSAVGTFQENLTVGAVAFPSDGGCGVAPIESSPQFDFMPGPQFLSAFGERALGPLGSTPLLAAFQQADLAVQRAVGLGLLENRFRVLLFSDGEPTCGDDLAALVSYPTRWREQGIDTYVLALPGSEVAAHLLDAIADAGGTGAEQGGGAAITSDEQAQAVYMEGVEEQGASRVVVDDEEELDDVTHAAAR